MNQVKHVVVVGGGTAGWLTAANLAYSFNSKKSESIQVTLVESPDIPIIGVGEGTWPTIRTTLQRLGIDEAEFMMECDATFKQGTCFVNWADNPSENDKSYYHLFSTVNDSYEFNLAPYWILSESKHNYASAVGLQGDLCDKNLAPKKLTTPAYEGIQNYSYHLNAGKFGKFLAKHATKNLGVKHLLANVEKINLDCDGYIESIDTDVKGRINGDFFIDCTGFKSMLLGEALDIDFIDVSDVLMNDTAVVMQVPYENEQEEIRPYTKSIAQEAGWIWDIGLIDRRGLGYVYSSKYTSHERAEDVFRSYVGDAAEKLNARKINMKVGYREKYFHKNCVAIGLSAAFIEPLEASAIFLVEAAANMLRDQFPATRAEMELVEEKFNQSFHFRWKKSIDFIKLHYMLSKRTDSQYWIDSRLKKNCSQSLLNQIEHWKTHCPSKYDFDNVYEPFVLDSYLYVLFGMGYKSDLQKKINNFNESKIADKKFLMVKAAKEMLAKENLPSHRELLNKVYQYGFSKI